MSTTTIAVAAGSLAFTGSVSVLAYKRVWGSKVIEVIPLTTPAYAISSVQKVTTTTSSAQTSAAVGANIVLLYATQDVHISDPTATTNDFFLKAGVYIAVSVDPSHLVAGIRDSADGVLYVTGVN
jgi:hypothetical protein